MARLGPLVATVCLATAPAMADQPFVADGIEILDYGIICSEGDVRREAAPETDLGYVTRPTGDVSVAATTRYVAAEPGLMFGVEAIARHAGLDDATMTVRHPPFPDTGTDEQSWETGFFTDEPTINYYRFDLPTEMVPGIWTFIAHANDTLLFSVEFRLRGPGLAPGYGEVCATLAAAVHAEHG